MQPETAKYYSDFSNVEFEDCGSPVSVKFDFGYGSKYDESTFTLHLTDDEVQKLLDVVKLNVSTNYKNKIKEYLQMAEADWNELLQAEDWEFGEQAFNNVCLYREILND